MAEINFKTENGELTVYLYGHVDTSNAAEIEREINDKRAEYPCKTLIFDCEKLEYISSAGLRIFMRIKKAISDTKAINVSSEVYDIFDITGFTEILEVKKAYRKISVEGCEVIGQGANGKVYRIDPETIVKVYLNPDALPDIQRERELARAAFVLGIPTAIPYDVVRIEGGGYGSVFELLNATSFAKLLIRGEKTVDEVAKMSIDLLKLIHSTVVKPGSMPDMKTVALKWASDLKPYLPKEQAEKLYSLIAAVPDDDHMMHGDYHIKNVMLQNGESLLIDMDTICHGHPVFEFASMYNAYVGYAALDHDVVLKFLGIPYEQTTELWRKSLELYLDTTDEKRIKEVEEKAMIVGYTRIMRRTIRRHGFDSEEGRATIEYCKKTLGELLSRTDTLTF